MLRYTTALLLLFGLFLAPEPTPVGPVPAHGAQIVNALPGTYENVSGGGYCYVYGRMRGYVFVNENGSQALFAPTGWGQLRMVSGDWDPSIVVSVGQDAYGRTQLRFDSPNAPTGYWVKVN
jgi:hypothetical protein